MARRQQFGRAQMTLADNKIYTHSREEVNYDCTLHRCQSDHLNWFMGLHGCVAVPRKKPVIISLVKIMQRCENMQEALIINSPQRSFYGIVDVILLFELLSLVCACSIHELHIIALFQNNQNHSSSM